MSDRREAEKETREITNRKIPDNGCSDLANVCACPGPDCKRFSGATCEVSCKGHANQT
ncbi:hypothetical protein DPMN_138917 [Dreissena polymorpha]|uniref:Uncharacterized protein n=1 Tax=Dreissena polymorpha TaxID=45954 RepID=A0A9D4G5D3_DREPO|nr:hypothetical protein DPMN_138917 [Dreissena polymorpha]